MKHTTNRALSTTLDFCVRLLKANAALSRRFDGRLGTWHGLSFGDFVVLLHLSAAPDGRLRRVDLAQQLGVTASAVTRTLIPLEKIGLVTRQRDPHDARVGYAVLTATGHQMLARARESAEMISQELIPPAALAHISRLTEALSLLTAS
jgi:DNA-binding MarR family transcriptional regulator